MSARLQELLQQRRLIEEHLAWLDREIAQLARSPAGNKEAFTAPSSSLQTEVSKTLPTPPPSPARQDSPPTTLDEAADALLAEYREPTENLQLGVKRGCLLYFGTALVLLFLGLFLIYLYSPHPSPPPASRSEVPAVEKRVEKTDKAARE